jgi:very-short-patch-repair endonuclease
VPAERRVGLCLHRHQVPPEGIHRGMATTRVQTVIDCARFLPFDQALCVADSAMRQSGVSRAQLLAAAELVPAQDRARVLRVVHAADARAENPFESCLRAIATGVAGLSVTPQLDVDGIGRADLVDPALRLVLEADSFEFHSEQVAFRNDIRRYTAMVRAQWRVARFCWEDVMFQQEYVAAVLTDLVASGPVSYARSITPAVDPRLGMSAWP